MLSEPLSINIDGSSVSFARVSSGDVSGSPSIFRSIDGAFQVFILERRLPKAVEVEITLTKTVVETDANPFNGPYWSPQNSVSIKFQTDPSGFGADVDLPALQLALLSFLTNPIRDRILNGEK